MLRLQFHNLFYPPSDVLAPEGKPATAKTADDINDLFKEIDTEEVVEKKEPKEKEEKPEKEDEELELIEPEDEIEKLDLKEPEEEIDVEARVLPRKREILSK